MFIDILSIVGTCLSIAALVYAAVEARAARKAFAALSRMSLLNSLIMLELRSTSRNDNRLAELGELLQSEADLIDDDRAFDARIKFVYDAYKTSGAERCPQTHKT